MKACFGLVKRYPLTAYFFMVFGVEWLLVLLLATITPPLVALLVGSWLPNLIGVVVTGLAGGRTALRVLFSKVVLWRINIKWYASALFLPVVCSLVAIGLYGQSGGAAPAFTPLSQLPVILLGAIFTGALGEELGWRGTALPLLQSRWNPLLSSLILGVLWGLYHLPSFLLSGLPLQDVPILPFMLSALALTVIITWSFNRTHGTLIIVFLYHFSFNFIGNATGIFADPVLFRIFAGVVTLLAGLLVALDWSTFTHPISQPTCLSRKGFQNGLDPQL